MTVFTNVRDIESATTSSWPGGGAATPVTDTEVLRDHPDIHEWLSGQNGAFEVFGSLRVTRASVPRAGDTFLIIDKSRNRALVCHDGHLHLEDMNTIDPEKPISGRWQWFCTEKDGFKGFQNVSHRGFLGHDIWWDFYAKVPHHKGWESFVVDMREGGYYWIQALNWSTLWQVSARFDGRGVFAERDGGTLWEFAKVHTCS